MHRPDRIYVETTIPWHQKKANRRHVLQWLVETRNVRTMAEVGVRDGRTSFHLLEHCANLELTAIDLEVYKFYTPEVAERYGKRLRVLQGNSSQVADLIEDASLDLVFIDADHSYEGVCKDILAYTPKLKPSGLLTGHDIDFFGVNRAVKELIGNFEVAPNNVWIRAPL